MSAPVSTPGRTLDHAAAVYDILSPLMLLGQEQRISRMCLDLHHFAAGEKILDVGCGTGSLTIALARRVAPDRESLVVGIDAAAKMLEVARRKAGDLANVRFDHGIAEALPYEDETFGYAVSTFFFHHVNAALKAKSLDEIWRVLKPAGEAVVIDVDVPTSIMGRICAWSGYLLFRQDEIRENIRGVLRETFGRSRFRSWHRVSGHLGYISVFRLLK
jgi:ubiquinone/menaquinone biosynthesis C-methylase UbiE